MHEQGWLHFEQTSSRRDPATGERRLSVAVVDDGVVFTVVKDGRPASCAIGFDDWTLLQHFVEVEGS